MQDSANIGQLERVTLSDLSTYINNPRRGDVKAIAASMKTNGVYKPLVVNKGTHTGRPYEVLAGNHSLKAMRHLAEEHPEDDRWQRADVYVVDVDEDRAAKIVLADNRTSDLGSYDNDELLDLLQSVDNELDGTGYDDEFVEAMLGSFSPDHEAGNVEDPYASIGEQDDDDDGGEYESYDENIDTDYRCPKCDYEWSGSPK